MVKSRVKTWLMEHPEALSMLASWTLILAEVADGLPTVSGKSGASGVLGP